MPVFLKEDHKVLYVHVPKTGGTTIERAFKDAGWTVLLRETSNTHPRLHKLRTTSPQHYQASLLAETLHLDKFTFTFMTTREPLSRFRSEYLMRNHESPTLTEEAVDSWAERTFERYAANPYVYDNHIRPQSEFVLDSALVYQLEDGLDSLLSELNTRIADAGLPTTADRRLTSAKRAGARSEDVPISASLEARLRDFYRDDFKSFGY